MQRHNVFKRCPYYRSPPSAKKHFCKCRHTSLCNDEDFARNILHIDVLVPCKEVLIHYKKGKEDGDIIRYEHELTLSPFSLKHWSMAACAKFLQTVQITFKKRVEYVKTLKHVIDNTNMKHDNEFKLRTNFVGQRTTFYFDDFVDLISTKEVLIKFLQAAKPFCHCLTLADTEITVRFIDYRVHFFRFIREGMAFPEHVRQERNGHYSFCPTQTDQFYKIIQLIQ